MALTKKQLEVLKFIEQYWQDNEVAPTQKEIKDHFCFKSYGSVQRYLKYLQEYGAITLDWNARRGIKLPDSSTQINQSENNGLLKLPLLGLVAAGSPLYAEESYSDYIELPPSWISGDNAHYALEISGESMIEAGINSGDIVIVEQNPCARKGQIVVALWNNEATVKYYYPNSESIELRPANSTMEPFILTKDTEDFKILGIVKGLWRPYV